MNSFIIAAALLSPPHFIYSGQEKAVFVDFTQAHYRLQSDGSGVNVHTEIEFDQLEAGHMIFDLKTAPSEVILDGTPIRSYEIKSPDRETKLRTLSVASAVGHHKLTLKSHVSVRGSLDNEVYFKMRDLRSRRFLEQYLPTNLEYDQYPMRFSISFPSNFEIMSNAAKTQIAAEGRTLVELQYPASSNTSSVFFHAFPKGRYSQVQASFTSSTGKVIPIEVYGKASQDLRAYAEKALRVLAELDQDYGEYSHPSLLVFARGSGGGMEYAGATESSLVSLEHELFHSYFGRSVMPANGNSGCLDEALASWRDYGYQQMPQPRFTKSSICTHSAYARNTDSNSYKIGRQFFAYVDFKLDGGLKTFLKQFYLAHRNQVVTIEQFRDELVQFAGPDLADDFNRYLGL